MTIIKKWLESIDLGLSIVRAILLIRIDSKIRLNLFLKLEQADQKNICYFHVAHEYTVLSMNVNKPISQISAMIHNL